jgi:hypothetical protein
MSIEVFRCYEFYQFAIFDKRIQALPLLAMTRSVGCIDSVRVLHVGCMAVFGRSASFRWSVRTNQADDVHHALTVIADEREAHCGGGGGLRLTLSTH